MSPTVAVVVALAGSMVAMAAAAAPAPKIVIAHRGASGYLPEHTLPAIAMAHAQGADYLEQDVVLSKDDVPVVLHDIHIDTVTDVARRFPDRKRADGRYYALDFTVAELKQLNASERFDPKTGIAVFPSRFPVGKGSFQIPTLEEELQLIQGLNTSTGREAGVYPEIKEPAWHRTQGREISPIVLDLLARYGYRTKADKVYVQCFDEAEVKRIRLRARLQGTPGAAHRGQPAAARRAQAPAHGGRAWRTIAKVADGIGPALSDVVTRKGDGGLAATSLVRDAHAAAPRGPSVHVPRRRPAARRRLPRGPAALRPRRHRRGRRLHRPSRPRGGVPRGERWMRTGS